MEGLEEIRNANLQKLHGYGWEIKFAVCAHTHSILHTQYTYTLNSLHTIHIHTTHSILYTKTLDWWDYSHKREVVF